MRKYAQDRDQPVETVGITGLRENSCRDGGIEEAYWGPSHQPHLNAKILLNFVHANEAS